MNATLSGDAVRTDHWFEVGGRTAEKIQKDGKKQTAEQCANIKGLYGTPRMQFIAGFRLYTVTKESI